MINTRAGPEGKLGIHSQESRAAGEGALAFVAQCPWKALTVLTDKVGISKLTALNSPKHSSAQASSFPPPKKPSNSSLSRAAAPGELRVRNCRFPWAHTSPGHAASCPARACNSPSLTAPAASGEGQQQAGPHLPSQNTVKHPANCVVNKNHKSQSWELHIIQHHNLVLPWTLVVKTQ